MTQAQPEPGPGWGRKQITFWLTPARKAGLMDIANGMAGATPSDALARAIDIARERLRAGGADPSEIIDAVESVDARIADAIAEARDHFDTQQKAIAGLATDLRAFNRHLAELAGGDGADSGEIEPATGVATYTEPPSFQQWMSASLRKAGARPKRSAVARASWEKVGRASAGFVAIDFRLSLATIDGQPVALALASQSSVARFGLQPETDPMSRPQWGEQMYFVCQPAGAGWVVHAHRAGADGSAGSAIGRLSA